MNLAPGAYLGPLRLTVAAARMADLAEVLDDRNQIHLDAEVVKALGMGDRVINQGPANIAYLVNLLEGLAPGVVVDDLDVRLLANVFDGEVVEAGGMVDEVAGDRARCTVWLEAATGSEAPRRAIEGTAVIRFPTGPR